MEQTFSKLIEHLDDSDPENVIVVRGPLAGVRAETLAMEVSPDEDPPEGWTYLLEVGLAREARVVWAQWRGKASLTSDEAVRAVAYYALNDAFEPVHPETT